MRNVILYIATSLDGYIARSDGDISFLDKINQTGEDYGYAEFYSKVDVVVVGRKTYDKVLTFGIGWPHTGKESYVVSRWPRPVVEGVTVCNGPPEELVRNLKQQPGGDIFIDGGAELVHSLILHDLIDTYCISTIPVLLGEGVRLFRDGRPEHTLEHFETRTFTSGLVQTWYRRIR